MSQEIEAKVLAAVMSDRFLLTKVVNDGFSPDHFRDQYHRILFKTVYDMSQVPGQVVDWITLENTLQRSGWSTPELVQAIVRLKKAEAPQADQLMAYVDILKDESLREGMRKLAAVMSEYCERGGEHQNEEFLDFNSRIIQGLIALQKQKVKKRVSPLKETISEIRELTDRPRTPEKQLLGFSIKPFERLEHILSGIRKGFYYGVAGPPRRGKTTFSLDIASKLAERNKFPVLFYTWEQTRRTLAARLLGRECYINPVKLLTEVSPEEKQRHALVNKVIERSAAYSNNLFVIEAGRTDTIRTNQSASVQHHARIPLRRGCYFLRLSSEDPLAASI